MSVLRSRILAAATEITTASGWSSVTMGRIADEVGVSRQTVYNEVGSKTSLAEAMILDELHRFLVVVEKAFDNHPTDLVAAIEAAACDVLVHAQGNALLHAVVSATHGADTELLPLLTTHSSSLMAVARSVIGERLTAYDVPVTEEERHVLVDLVVRVVLSHLMAPAQRPEQTAASIAWLAARVLRP